jgi:glycosyltransferase involved in cell wall biosynthesis
MTTPIGSITRAATRQPGEPLNVLTFPTHERYQSGLGKTNAIYYLFRAPQVKDWNQTYAPLPENHILLNPSKGMRQLPADVDFDLVLSQNKFGQFQIASQLSRQLHLPLVSLEHTLPVPAWDQPTRDALKRMRGHLNLFISEYSIGQWGWDVADPSVRVIHHGIDTDTFSPNEMLCDRRPHLLSVVNDWVNRDWCCGFRLWQDVSRERPVRVVGATPGLSEPAKSVHDLVMAYRSSLVFLNTSLISPVPTALLEAMSCGCAVVSTATCMIPEVIRHEENGFVSNDPKELRFYCDLLLKNPDLARAMGAAARQTILERFSLGRFVSNWNGLLAEAANTVYTGAP